MAEWEKVIKGLEICSSGEWNSTGGRDHTSCPYYPAGYTGCTCKLLMRDALALLKAQEPRVMTLEEVKEAKGNDLFLEISTRTDEKPYITAATLDGVGLKGVTFYHSPFDFKAYNKKSPYGWRCWTVRPTNEQRKAAKWDD